MNDPTNSADSPSITSKPDKASELLDEPDAGQIAGETFEQVGAGTVKKRPHTQSAKAPPNTGRSAFFVGAGILISRLGGLVRQRIFAHYFGSSAVGDAF